MTFSLSSPSFFDETKLEEFPKKPGCYLMKDEKGVVLYVGKAVNLKARIKQYFQKGSDERAQVPYLLEHVRHIDTIIVSSEKEALLLENTLIKRYQPKYNVLLKDDKSYLSVKITTNHDYPMMAICRYKGKPPKGADYFGPYTNATKARSMFDLISRLFPLRQCSDEEFQRRERPCLLYQIKRCLGPCVNLCSENEYANNVENAKKILSGHTQELVRALKKEMDEAARRLEFEKAALYLKKIRALETVQDTQNVEAISADSVDVIALYRKNQDVVITKLLYRDSKLVDFRHFEFENVVEDDTELLHSFLLQHYLKVDELMGQEVLLSSAISDLEVIAEIISDARDAKVVLFAPQKGEKKRLLELALMNAEARFHAKKDKKEVKEKELLLLQEKLNLAHFPRRIECFDNSHIAGTSLVAAQVVFVNGEKYKAGYRKYHIKTVKTGDDYAMLKEVLTRRFSQAKRENELPDLIIIDGGKGHYHTACKLLSELGIISSDVIAIAKEESRHDKGVTQEIVFCPGLDAPLLLDRHSQLLQFLQMIRDEAHRFAIAFHKETRKKALIQSALDDIPGIGPMKKRSLLMAFGSVKAIQEKTVEELCKVKGIGRQDAALILSHLAQRKD